MGYIGNLLDRGAFIFIHLEYLQPQSVVIVPDNDNISQGSCQAHVCIPLDMSLLFATIKCDAVNDNGNANKVDLIDL